MTISQSIVEPFASRSGRRPLAAGVAAIAASVLLGLAPTPAAAQSRPSWEQGCAYRQPSGMFGDGRTITNEMCAKLSFCQNQADRGREMPGCVGFAPASPASDKRR